MKENKLEYYTKNKYSIREVSEEELLTFKKDIEFIMYYSHFEELFSILKHNFSDFWKYLFELSEYNRMNNFAEFNDYIEPLVLINQRLLNILTSFKSYEDIIKSHLEYHSNTITKTLPEINVIFSNYYDKYFGFRFMCRLRNYAQHFRLPIQGISYGSDVINKKENHVAYSVEPKFLKKELLQYSKWNTIYPEIEKMDDSIGCKSILGEFYIAVNELHSALREILYTNYKVVIDRMDLI